MTLGSVTQTTLPSCAAVSALKTGSASTVACCR